MRYGWHIVKMSLLQEFKAAVAEKGELLAQIAGLKEKLTASNFQLTEATAQHTTAIESLNAKLTELTTKLSAAEATAADLLSAKTALEKQLADATAAKDAAEAKAKELVENPSAVALQIAAKAGVKPEDRPAAKTEDKPKLKGFAAVQARIAAELSKSK